jgi:hypothetical protein
MVVPLRTALLLLLLLPLRVEAWTAGTCGFIGW